MATTGEKKLYPLGDTDWAVPPGETLLELLEERGMSQRDLARRTGAEPKARQQAASFLLHRLGFSPQVPAHRAFERDEDAIAAVPSATWAKVRGQRR